MWWRTGCWRVAVAAPHGWVPGQGYSKGACLWLPPPQLFGSRAGEPQRCIQAGLAVISMQGAAGPGRCRTQMQAWLPCAAAPLQDRDAGEDEQEFALSRFVPMLQEVLEDAGEGAVGSRQGRAGWATGRLGVAVYFVGGDSVLDCTGMLWSGGGSVQRVCGRPAGLQVVPRRQPTALAAPSLLLQLPASCRRTSTPLCARRLAQEQPACPAARTAPPKQVRNAAWRLSGVACSGHGPPLHSSATQAAGPVLCWSRRHVCSHGADDWRVGQEGHRHAHQGRVGQGGAHNTIPAAAAEAGRFIVPCSCSAPAACPCSRLLQPFSAPPTSIIILADTALQ